MATLVGLQERYDRAMHQDMPREQLPKGSVWNMIDYVPNLGALLRKRGGWAYASPNIQTTIAGAGYIFGLVYAPFAAGSQLIGFTDNGRLVKINSVSSVTDVGACQYPPQQPPLHFDKLIIPAHDGSTAPRYYDGTVLGNLPGSPPAGAKYAAVWKDYTILAKGSKVYFSQPIDPTLTWDVTNSWWSVSGPVTGLATLTGAMLIFMGERTARLRGSVPPPDGDMILDDPLFNIGCSDARSIVTDRGQVIFANEEGVYRSNASIFPEDLTETCGAKKLWRETLSAYTTAWTIAGGLFRNEYWCVVLNETVFVDCFIFDLTRLSFRRAANIPAAMLASASQVGEELYFACRDEARVGKLSTTYTPSSTYKNDADGTAVVPVIEYPYYHDRPGKKTWRSLYLDYDLRDAASDNPVLTVSVQKTPAGAYTALTPTLAETADKRRARLALRFPAEGLGVKIAQTNASADTRLYELSADVHAREGSRL